MAIFGSTINPALGRVDYSPLAQGLAQGGQLAAQGLSNFGTSVAQGIQTFLKKQEDKQNEQEGINFIKAQFPGIGDAEAKAGLKAAGGAAAFVKFRQDMGERQKAQEAMSYAAMLAQGGGNVPSPISNQTLAQFSPEARMMGQSAYLQQARAQAELDKVRAETLRSLSPKAPEAPSGFRFTPTGNLEEIPGGPAAASRKREEEQAGLAREAAARQEEELRLRIEDAAAKATSEQEKKRLAEEAAKAATEDARVSAESTLREIDKARVLIKAPLAQGFGSSVGGFFGGSAANDLETSYDVIRANEALNRIIALKKASPTGATGFGALNLKELETLQSRFAKLTRSASDQAANTALNDLERVIGRAFPDVREQLNQEKKAFEAARRSKTPVSPTQSKSGSRFEFISASP